MEFIDESTQYEKNARAGLVPWTRENGIIKYLTMVASDPKFGGPRPMISKGKIEDNENAYECALREAQEELGLVVHNMVSDPKLVCQNRVVLRSGTYDLTVYAVQIMERWNFVPWCDETEYTVWLSLDEFRQKGRRDHLRILEEIEEKIVKGEI